MDTSNSEKTSYIQKLEFITREAMDSVDPNSRKIEDLYTLASREGTYSYNSLSKLAPREWRDLIMSKIVIDKSDAPAKIVQIGDENIVSPKSYFDYFPLFGIMVSLSRAKLSTEFTIDELLKRENTKVDYSGAPYFVKIEGRIDLSGTFDDAYREGTRMAIMDYAAHKKELGEDDVDNVFRWMLTLPLFYYTIDQKSMKSVSQISALLSERLAEKGSRWFLHFIDIKNKRFKS